MTKASKIYIVRQFATRYFSTHDAKEDEYSGHGAASTEQGAIAATVVRIFLKQYAKALIIDRMSGAVIYTIKLDSYGLRVLYGREAKDYERLRLVRKAA